MKSLLVKKRCQDKEVIFRITSHSDTDEFLFKNMAHTINVQKRTIKIIKNDFKHEKIWNIFLDYKDSDIINFSTARKTDEFKFWSTQRQHKIFMKKALTDPIQNIIVHANIAIKGIICSDET